MEKKATLLLQHIEVIYPMVSPISSTISHGFIAIHHDYILAIGEGEGGAFIDKDTRIIEGRGYIAVPAMIDVAMKLPIPSQGLADKQMIDHDHIRYIREHCATLMKHGTLVGNITGYCPYPIQDIIHIFSLPYDFAFLHTGVSSVYEVIVPLNTVTADPIATFCISCGNQDCLDQWLCAKLMYRNSNKEAIEILAGCTCHPADALGVSMVGRLSVGKSANIIMMKGNNLANCMCNFHGDEYMRIIKEGVHIYPNKII